MTPKASGGSFLESEGDAFASDWGGWEKQPAQRKYKSQKPPSSQKTLSPGRSDMVDSPDGVAVTKSVSSPAVSGAGGGGGTEGKGEAGGGEGKTPLATSTPARPQGKSQVYLIVWTTVDLLLDM